MVKMLQLILIMGQLLCSKIQKNSRIYKVNQAHSKITVSLEQYLPNFFYKKVSYTFINQLETLKLRNFKIRVRLIEVKIC
jgi:hypothetical protein